MEAGVKAGREAAMAKVVEMIQVVAEEMAMEAGFAAGETAGVAEAAKIADWKAVTGEKIAEIRKQFEAVGSAAGKEAASVQLKSSLVAKIQMSSVVEFAVAASVASAEKYSVKAREFCKMAAKISEEAGGKAAAELAKNEGGEEGEAEGEKVGEQVRAASFFVISLFFQTI